MNIWLKRLFLVLSTGGGFTGFTVTAPLLFRSYENPLNYVLFVAVMTAYAFGIYAGIKLVEKEEIGLSLLSWYFLAQVPVVISPVASYLFSSGVTTYVTIGSPGGLSWGFYIGGRWQISILNFNDTTIAFGLNIFAIWATWLLRKQLAKSRANQALLPTPMLATDHADPRSAPDTGAADL
jgi:hypothetical protein